MSAWPRNQPLRSASGSCIGAVLEISILALACGFYLGSIGGPAAILAQNNIKKVDVLEFPELGMEAIWKIEVEDFPAFVIVDDKGNDFFKKWQT